MSETRGGLTLLVAAGDQSFGSAVVDAIDATEVRASAERADVATDVFAQSERADVDGAIVDDRIAEPATVVGRLTDERDLPVVVLTDPTESGDTVARALEAGAMDVFPRTTTTAQYELIVERIAGEARDRDSSTAERASAEQPYREVFENVSDGLVIHEPDTGEMLDVNERFCELTGYGRDELVGETVDLVTADEEGDSYERAKELIQRVRDEGAQLFEWREQHRDGHTFPVEVHLSLVDLHGEERVLASVRDITERKRREREYEQIFDMAGDGIVIHDPDSGAVVDANQQVADLLGYDREAFLDRPLSAFQATDEGVSEAQARELIRESARTGGQEFEWPLETSDGNTVWVRARHELGEIGGEERIVALFDDITERRRREREFEQVFNEVQGGITINDPETGEMVEVNDSFCDLLGYSREEILEMGVEGVSASDEGFTMERAREMVQEVVETGEPEQTEWAVRTSDGETRWLSVRGTPAEIGGKQRYLSLTRDITERRELERTYQDIFEGVSDGLVVHDPDTSEILEVNDQYCELTGYDRQELLGETVRLIVPEDSDYTYEDAVTRLTRAREEGSQLFEFKGERKNGDEFVGEIHLSTIELRGTECVLASVRDITERKRREREYEQIFNGVNDSIVIQDPETAEPVDANETFLDRLGYDDVAEIRETGFEGLSAAEAGYTRERAQELCQRVIETGEPEVVEWHQKTRAGDSRWIEAKVDSAVIQGEERILSIQRDITERKRRERAIQALQDATERLQSAQTPEEVATIAVETASDALDLPMAICWFHDADADRLEPAAATDAVREAGLVSGLSPDRYEHEVFLEGDVTEYAPNERAADNPLETSVLLPLGDHGLVAAGTYGDTEADSAVLDVAKALADHVTTALDRVEREQAVRESERRFRLIAERIDEVIYLAEPDLSEVLYVNPAYEEVWGQPVETLYDDATAFLETVDERDRERFETNFEAMIADIDAGDPAESYEFEFRLRRPSGEVRWVHATGYAVELSGGTRRFVGIVDDITERKRREQRLEVFNRILRHNLRNQLDVIRGHAEVLADQTADDHADRIIAAVDELAGIGARARETDRIISMGDTLAEVDLSEVVRETLGAIEPERSDVAVTTELPRSAHLKTNEQAATVAVESAVENALEHAESATTVGIEESPDGYVVTIDDDGPGIPEEELVPIEAGRETNLQHGRGLGLWQLRWSVDKLNGELSFDAAGGTTVRITIPDRSSSRATTSV